MMMFMMVVFLSGICVKEYISTVYGVIKNVEILILFVLMNGQHLIYSFS